MWREAVLVGMAEAIGHFGDGEVFSRGVTFEKRSGIIESPSSLPIWRSCRHPDDEAMETLRFADIVRALQKRVVAESSVADFTPLKAISG